ncbi:hypothetical protein TIFTF001_008177 [Ficus carica]|uniref:Uncharacterized protein n=1 Tax=Ficus carica TaxID=3494 RepID=A0AA87ZSV5_FICCA|nr:hypothetical protein TIFTF001_008177 [Ficus carica]
MSWINNFLFQWYVFVRLRRRRPPTLSATVARPDDDEQIGRQGQSMSPSPDKNPHRRENRVQPAQGITMEAVRDSSGGAKESRRG